MFLTPIDDPVDLEGLAKAIRGSSNFRFAWQFFRVYGEDLRASATVAQALDVIVKNSEHHSFLADSMDPRFPQRFEIHPLHIHATLELDGGCFLDTMACASLDRLGAYSCDVSPSTSDERREIHRIFSGPGRYFAFHPQRGDDPDCEHCRKRNNELFSNWFFDVAWDFTFLVTWQDASLLWMGCLTDTD